MVKESDNIDRSLVACLVGIITESGMWEAWKTDLLSLLDVCTSCFARLLLALSLLQQCLRDHDLVLGRDGSV